MKELWLKFKNEYGEPENVRVDRENFVIGRSPENDLSITRSQLSRTHAEINRFSDVFVISDCNSSNGTTLNGVELMNPVELKNGDRINLGGGIEIEVELVAAAGGGSDEFEDEFEPAIPAGSSASDTAGENSPENEGAANPEAVSPPVAPASTAAATAGAGSAAQPGGSILKSFFIIAPIFAVVILLFVGVMVLLVGGRKGKEVKPEKDDDYISSSGRNGSSKRNTKIEDLDDDKTPTPKPTGTPGATETPSNSTVAVPSTPTPAVSNDLDKLERNALPFMRRIAVNDDNYVFTQKQLGEINNQIKVFKGSASLRSNLKAVKKDAAKFEELAKSKGLKPQFLATAALAKIGNQNQDPLSVAQTMLPILGELKITLGNELSDENLLVIAAYDLGEQGKFRALQSTLEGLTKQSPGVASNKIRTIWFLREKGKITEAQYAFALRFLAIGAIAQNPKDFNVDTEAVTF